METRQSGARGGVTMADKGTVRGGKGKGGGAEDKEAGLTAAEGAHIEKCVGCKKLYEKWKKNQRDVKAREALRKLLDTHLKASGLR